jgi:hypothetical protein
MSDKFNALWIILNKLDQKEKVTARSLTEDLEVSERSVYRYITTLQVAGFPVDYDRGMNSYVFSGGVHVEETRCLCGRNPCPGTFQNLHRGGTPNAMINENNKYCRYSITT